VMVKFLISILLFVNVYRLSRLKSYPFWKTFVSWFSKKFPVLENLNRLQRYKFSSKPKNEIYKKITPPLYLTHINSLLFALRQVLPTFAGRRIL